MSITFMPMIHDPATNEWRIPEAARVDRDRFEFNVANANGFRPPARARPRAGVPAGNSHLMRSPAW